MTTFDRTITIDRPLEVVWDYGETEAHGVFRLAEPVFARMARGEWATSCSQLKDMLEAGASSKAAQR